MEPKTDYIVPMAMIGCLMIFAAALAVLMGANFIGNVLLVVGAICIILTLIFIFGMPMTPPPIQPLPSDPNGN